MHLPKVKVCCIASIEEARMAISDGAWALGLVAEMPSGVGPINDELIADIARSVKGEVETFLLTSRVDGDAIIEHHEFCKTTTIQMVDHVPHPELRKIRKAIPGVRLVQVIHVTGEESLEEARHAAPLVDAILLDSGNQSLEVKELGGTGRTHDWSLSRKIRDAVGVPLFLAGGLNPANVAGAIAMVQPFGVDLCSGLRTDSKLDARKLGEFFRSVRAANH